MLHALFVGVNLMGLQHSVLSAHHPYDCAAVIMLTMTSRNALDEVFGVMLYDGRSKVLTL